MQASRSIFREIEARFVETADFGPKSYSRQALGVEPESDQAQLAQDAVGAIAESIVALELP